METDADGARRNVELAQLQPGTSVFMVGMVIHLMIWGLIALIYAWGFETLTHQSGARTRHHRAASSWA